MILKEDFICLIDESKHIALAVKNELNVWIATHMLLELIDSNSFLLDSSAEENKDKIFEEIVKAQSFAIFFEIQRIQNNNSSLKNNEINIQGLVDLNSIDIKSLSIDHSYFNQVKYEIKSRNTEIVKDIVSDFILNECIEKVVLDFNSFVSENKIYDFFSWDKVYKSYNGFKISQESFSGLITYFKDGDYKCLIPLINEIYTNKNMKLGSDNYRYDFIFFEQYISFSEDDFAEKLSKKIKQQGLTLNFNKFENVDGYIDTFLDFEYSYIKIYPSSKKHIFKDSKDKNYNISKDMIVDALEKPDSVFSSTHGFNSKIYFKDGNYIMVKDNEVMTVSKKHRGTSEGVAIKYCDRQPDGSYKYYNYEKKQITELRPKNLKAGISKNVYSKTSVVTQVLSEKKHSNIRYPGREKYEDLLRSADEVLYAEAIFSDGTKIPIKSLIVEESETIVQEKIINIRLKDESIHSFKILINGDGKTFKNFLKHEPTGRIFRLNTIKKILISYDDLDLPIKTGSEYIEIFFPNS